jgi:outer membrane autotransporter protein
MNKNRFHKESNALTTTPLQAHKPFKLKPLFCHMAMLGSALLSAPALADCVQDAQGKYTCAGDLQQTTKIEEKNTTGTLYVTTSGKFNIEAPTGDALYIENLRGPVFYTDAFASPLISKDTTKGFGLNIKTFGHSVDIITNGPISGIQVKNTLEKKEGEENLGYGSINITTTGDIDNTTVGTGANPNDGMGISVTYSAAADSPGKGVTINTHNVSGRNDAINVLNLGVKGTQITTQGNIISKEETGIYVRTKRQDAANITINTTGGTVTGKTSGITVKHAGSGKIDIDTRQSPVRGEGFAGIHVDTLVGSTADISITTADVTGGGAGIRVDNAGLGNVTINSQGSIKSLDGTTEEVQAGIVVTNSNQNATGNIMINATGPVSANLRGIVVQQAGTGATNITSTGPISAVSGVGIYAENTHTSAKAITVHATDVTSPLAGIMVSQAGTGAVKITAKGNVLGTGAQGVNAAITNPTSTADMAITAQGNVTGAANGILATHAGAGKISITATHAIGGTNAIQASSKGLIDITLNGVVSNESQQPTDVAVTTLGGATTLTNSGQLTGTLQFENLASKVINTGTWNTAGEAIQWFGRIQASAPAATVVNTGIINTAHQSSQAEVTRFSGLATFINAGTLNMTDKGNGGDQVEIDGHYIGERGKIIMDTVLGDDNVPADKLRLQRGSSGQTDLFVLKRGTSHGELTHEGIKLIDVTNGPSDGKFTLKSRVVDGPYEYELYQGSVSNPNDGHWYLRSHDGTGKKYHPEVGAYLGNQQAAQNMFMHTVSMRDGGGKQAGGAGGWGRIIGKHNKNTAAAGSVQEKTTMEVVHLGHDIARWSSNEQDQWHIGLLGGAGYSKTQATARNNPAKAYGKVKGYGLGLYGSWFANAQHNQGLYVDTWVQHGWYRNNVTKHDMPQENYRSRSVNSSIELGYGELLEQTATRQWIIETQGQLTHIHYRSKEVNEDNGTRIAKVSEHHLLKRLGIRISSQAIETSGLQPFVELNWLHGEHANKLKFGNISVANEIPKNRVQLKTGVQGTLSKNWQLWGHVGGEKGKKQFKSYEGSIGLKHSW